MIRKFEIGTAILLGVTALAAGAFNADLSGTWTGFAEIRTAAGASNRLVLHAAFRQSGASLTGALGPSTDVQFAIKDGRVQGDAVSFHAAMPERVYEFRMARAAGDSLKGEVRAAEGAVSGRIELVRQKAAAVRRTGPYFGEPLPGREGVPFADGIVGSTPVFSPDGTEMIWTRKEPGFKSTLMASRLENGAWTEPAPLRFSRSEFMDHNPALSADGRVLVFAASRPIEGRPRTFIMKSPMPASDLWVTTRTAAGTWGDPVLLAPAAATEYDEDCPRLAADGTVYFTSGRPAGDGFAGICRIRAPAAGSAVPEILPAPVNSPSGEIMEAVAPDQSWLMFRSMRPGGFGSADVYVSFREPDGAWGRPVNLGEGFNKPRRWALAFSPDRRYLFYTSDGGGQAKAYWMEAPRLEALRPAAAPVQAGEISIGTKFFFRSEFLPGDIPVRVHLPKDYASGASRYPVLVLLEIADDFVFASAAADFLAACGRIPGLIVVSVDVDKLAGPPQGMIDFMEKDLLPFVEKSFRSEPRRVLYGHSGRSFAALFILANRPDLFDAFICPGLGLSWPLEAGRLDLAAMVGERLGQTASCPKTLVFSLGDEKKFFAGVERFIGILKAKAPADFRWTYLAMPEDDHTSTKLKTLYQGLEFVFLKTRTR